MSKEELIENAPYKIGRKVMLEPVRSFCTGGPSTITDIDIRYDEMTGEPFRVYKISDKWWTELGGCHSFPEFMYDIDFNYFER